MKDWDDMKKRIDEQESKWISLPWLKQQIVDLMIKADVGEGWDSLNRVLSLLEEK